MYGIISKFVELGWLIKRGNKSVFNQTFYCSCLQTKCLAVCPSWYKYSCTALSEIRATTKQAQKVTKVSGLQQTAFLISAEQLLGCLATNPWKWKRQNTTQAKSKQNSVCVQLPAHDPQGQMSWADSKAPRKSSFFFFLINCFMYVKKKPYAC